jgi:hypothetical protein
MGGKYSKDGRKDNVEGETSGSYSGYNDEEKTNQVGQAKELGNFDRKKSLSKRFRNSCKKWAAQKGTVKTVKIGVDNIPSELEISKPADDNDKEKEAKTNLEPENDDDKEIDIGLIIAELVRSTYSRKTVTQVNCISAKSTEITDCTDDTQVALDDSKVNMEIERTSFVVDEGTSPNMTHIAEASHPDNQIEVNEKSVSIYSQNKVHDIEKPGSNEADNNNACKKISEKQKEEFQGHVPEIPHENQNYQYNETISDKDLLNLECKTIEIKVLSENIENESDEVIYECNGSIETETHTQVILQETNNDLNLDESMIDIEQSLTESPEKSRESPALTNVKTESDLDSNSMDGDNSILLELDLPEKNNQKQYPKQYSHDRIISHETDKLCFSAINENPFKLEGISISDFSEQNKNEGAKNHENHKQISGRALQMVEEYLVSVETNSQTNDYRDA